MMRHHSKNLNLKCPFQTFIKSIIETFGNLVSTATPFVEHGTEIPQIMVRCKLSLERMIKQYIEVFQFSCMDYNNKYKVFTWRYTVWFKYVGIICQMTFSFPHIGIHIGEAPHINVLNYHLGLGYLFWITCYKTYFIMVNLYYWCKYESNSIYHLYPHQSLYMFQAGIRLLPTYCICPYVIVLYSYPNVYKSQIILGILSIFRMYMHSFLKMETTNFFIIFYVKWRVELII